MLIKDGGQKSKIIDEQEHSSARDDLTSQNTKSPLSNTITKNSE